MLNRIASAFARRIVAFPVKALGAPLRAEVLESLSEQMTTTISTPRGDIRFYTPAPLLVWRATSLFSKEVDTIQWIDGFEEGGVLWDIGANVGVYTLYAAIRQHTTVIAFEPLASNFHVLSRNINLNSLGDRAIAYCVALSDRTRLGVLNIASPLMGSALSQFGAPGEVSHQARGQNAGTQGMVGFAIDDFVSNYEPAFPNYLKIDVDGLELPILQGARKTLADPRMRSLVVELDVSFDDVFKNTRNLLEEAGFHFVSRGPIQGSGAEACANHIFSKKPAPNGSAAS